MFTLCNPEKQHKKSFSESLKKRMNSNWSISELQSQPYKTLVSHA